MKTKLNRLAMTLALAFANQVGTVLADVNEITVPHKYETFQGHIVNVDEKERSIAVKGALLTRTFNGADDCLVSLEDKPHASWADLHPGQDVMVRFENTHGVRVAHEVIQRNQVTAGVITAIDPARKSMTVKHGAFNREFTLGESCAVVLKDDKSGSWNDLKPGHSVRVTYESPADRRVARRIEQRSAEFIGTIRALDVDARTIRAASLMADRKFNLADGCRIVVDGKSKAEMRDLRIGDKVAFSYEDNAGVLVATRIGRESEASHVQSASTGASHP
jgi:Cu/Ag efflux protein CusF